MLLIMGKHSVSPAGKVYDHSRFPWHPLFFFLSPTPPNLCQASLSFTLSQSLLKLMYMKSVIPSNHLILSSPSPPALNLSQYQGLFK